MTEMELEDFCISCITKYLEISRKKDLSKMLGYKGMKVYAYNLTKKEKAVAGKKSL